MKRILIVEDDVTMNRMITDLLKAEEYHVTSACTVKEALFCIGEASFDLAILDINLPDGSGFSLCGPVRERALGAVIFLTANDLETDMIKGYELGASDYITKPFSNSVLRHKVRAIFSLLDNARKPAHVVFDDGSLRIDFSAMHTWLNGEEIMLAPLEYRMLEIFIQNKEILLTRQRLLEKLWDERDNFVDEHTLTAAISRVRGKLERGGHKYIRTVYGMGYMFTVKDSCKNGEAL